MNRCFDCVYCCIYSHSLVDVCDIDEHRIADVYHDCCDDFVMVDEEE